MRLRDVREDSRSARCCVNRGPQGADDPRRLPQLPRTAALHERGGCSKLDRLVDDRAALQEHAGVLHVGGGVADEREEDSVASAGLGAVAHVEDPHGSGSSRVRARPGVPSLVNRRMAVHAPSTGPSPGAALLGRGQRAAAGRARAVSHDGGDPRTARPRRPRRGTPLPETPRIATTRSSLPGAGAACDLLLAHVGARLADPRVRRLRRRRRLLHGDPAASAARGGRGPRVGAAEPAGRRLRALRARRSSGWRPRESSCS